MMPDQRKKRNYTNLIIVFLIGLIITLGIIFLIRNVKGDKKDNNTTQQNNTNATTAPTATSTQILSSTTVTSTGSITPTPSITITTTPTPTGTPTPSATSTDGSTVTVTKGEVNIFFTKDPESYNEPGNVFWFTRQTKRKDAGHYVIESLVTGPGTDLTSQGYFTPIKLSGTSNCGGKDFTLQIDSSRKAVVKFCKTLDISGVPNTKNYRDAVTRIKSVVSEGLKQFPEVGEVAIQKADGSAL
jgi:hypothetical protein